MTQKNTSQYRTYYAILMTEDGYRHNGIPIEKGYYLLLYKPVQGDYTLPRNAVQVESFRSNITTRNVDLSHLVGWEQISPKGFKEDFKPLFPGKSLENGGFCVSQKVPEAALPELRKQSSGLELVTVLGQKALVEKDSTKAEAYPDFLSDFLKEKAKT